MSIKYLKKIQGVTAPVRVDVKPTYGKDLTTMDYLLGENKVGAEWYGTELKTSQNIVSSTDPFGDSSLVAKYELNGNATDTTGVYDGTATDITYGTGVFGQCGIFNGSTSVIQSITGLPTGNTTLSIGVWFKPSVLANAKILSVGDTSSNPNLFSLQMESDGSLDVNFYGDAYNAGANVKATVGVWTYAVLSHSNGLYSLYIDGVFVGSNTTTALNLTDTTLNIGRDVSAISFFSGSIDQVEVYNKALTSEEATTLYNQGKYSYNTTPLPPQSYIEDSSGQLAEFEVVGGVVVDIKKAGYVPAIVENAINVKRLTTTDNVKIVDFGIIANNSRYVMPNPFGNENYEGCIVRAEIYFNGMWSEAPQGTDSSLGSRKGGTSGYSNLEGLVVQTSIDFLATPSSGFSGTGHGTVSGYALTSVACRVIVTYIGEATNA